MITNKSISPCLPRADSWPQLRRSTTPDLLQQDTFIQLAQRGYDAQQNFPRTLSAKFQAYTSLLIHDRQYRRGFGAMAINQIGDGLVTGGFLDGLAALGAKNSRLAVTALGFFSVIEIGIAAASYITASHTRDNAEIEQRLGIVDEDLQRANNLHKLFNSGLIDLGAASTVLVCVACEHTMGLAPAAITTFLCLTKSIQAFNKSYENGAWNCLKYTLGNDASHAQQLHMRSTIAALEMGIGGMLYAVTSLIVFVSLAAQTQPSPAAVVSIVIVGGLLTALPKMTLS